jgi:AraC-like DNA-binding protein
MPTLLYFYFFLSHILKNNLSSRTNSTFAKPHKPTHNPSFAKEPFFAKVSKCQYNMKIHIKNMVCNRCIMVVKTELEKLGFLPVNLSLGEVELNKDIDDNEKSIINNHLQSFGFELIGLKKSRIIEKIKNIIIELVHHQDNDIKTNLSDVLSSKLHHDYNYLSNLFSEVEGTTIEKYFIAQKIEKVKELLVYDELSLSEIALRLNYSSVAYLSNQFKKVTGLTPSHFKQIREDKRKPLDEV